MGKRMTREMANSAAEQLGKMAFDKKIDEAKMLVGGFGDKMIQKYVPAPILALGKEYSSWLCGVDNVITVVFNGSHLSVRSDMQNPVARRAVEVSKEDWEMAKELMGNRKTLMNKKEDYIRQVSDALMQLRTEAKISQYFPEALPYLNFSDATAIIPHYTELRDMLKLFPFQQKRKK